LALWGSIRKSWAWICAITLLTVLAVAAYTLGQQKVYEAQATVLFDPQPPRPLGNQVQSVVDVGGEYWNNKEYYKTQFWVIQSQRLALEVVKELRLENDGGFIRNLPVSTVRNPSSTAAEEAAHALRMRLTVEPVRDSRLAVLRFRDVVPSRAHRILSTLVDRYVDNNLDDALSAMGMAADWLSGQGDSLKKELESSEMALHEYKKTKNILSVSMDDQSNMLRGEMQQLSTALTAIETRREQIAARRFALRKISTDDPANIPATELLSSPLLNELRSKYVQASIHVNELVASGKGEAYPTVLAAQAELDATRSALLSEVTNLQSAVDHEHAAASREVEGLRGLLEAAKQRALDLNLLEIEYNRLRRSKEDNEKLYGVVTERSKENDLTRMLRINNIRVVDRPQVPRAPVSPNVVLNLAGGLAFGLLLGFVAAIGREQLDRSLKTPDDAERVLGLTLLGLLPSMDDTGKEPTYAKRAGRRQQKRQPMDGAPELVVHLHPTSGVAEAARAIRTNIFFMSPDKKFRTLLVTSAAPAEGKTTVACCIAIAMAQAGRRVLLLDCDMRRPRIHRVFKQSNETGLTTALLDLDNVGSVVRDTEVNNLQIVTTGPIPPNPAEILHSVAFDRFLKAIAERVDHVIIDSPPVAPVTDAAVLSTRVDGTILVVRAFKTTKDLARRAVRSLRGVSGQTLGTVLNAVDFQRRDYGYQQYYYYRREGYAPDTSETKEAVDDDIDRPGAVN